MIFNKNTKKLLDEIELVFEDSLSLISSSLRGFLIPEDGKKFICVDFSSIEAILTAWLADDKKMLAAFFDKKDVYVEAAAQIYKCPESQIDSKKRQIGKVAVLSLGFGGGKGAFQKMAKAYGVEVSDEFADEIKQAYRDSHYEIVCLWHKLEKAALMAVNDVKKNEYLVKNKISYKQKGSFLLCKLPSGREIVYPYPKVENKETPWGEQKATLTAKWVDSVTHKWERRSVWYGILVENVIQAMARDLLVAAIFSCEEKNLNVVMHIHDEIVLEVAKNGASKDDVIKTILDNKPKWAADIPLSLDGWEGFRYRK